MKKLSKIISKLGGIIAILSVICIFLLDEDNDSIFRNIIIFASIFALGSLVCLLFYDTKITNAVFIAATAMLVHIWYRMHRNLIVIGKSAEKCKKSSNISERELVKRVYRNTVIYNLEHEDKE